MPVPPSATAGFGDDDALAGFVEISEQDVVIGVVDQCAGRDGDEHLLAVLAGHLLALAGFTALRFPVMPAHEIEQRVFILVGDEDDVPAVATVAAVGSA